MVYGMLSSTPLITALTQSRIWMAMISREPCNPRRTHRFGGLARRCDACGGRAQCQIWAHARGGWVPGLPLTSGAASMADSSQPAIMEIMPTSASGVAPAGGGPSEHAIGASKQPRPGIFAKFPGGLPTDKLHVSALAPELSLLPAGHATSRAHQRGTPAGHTIGAHLHWPQS